jgi:DNA-binding beta-propeller fold protein YncE
MTAQQPTILATSGGFTIGSRQVPIVAPLLQYAMRLLQNKYLGASLLCLLAINISYVPGAKADRKILPLTQTEAIVVPGGRGDFDWMQVDAVRRRLLAAHTDKGTLEILDLKKEKMLATVPAGEVRGIAFGEKVYILGDGKEHKLVFVDADTLKMTGEVDLPGEVDAIAYEPITKQVYADHDDGVDVWVVDVPTKKLVQTINIGGAPEYIEYDSKTNRLYQNNKTKNTVEVIDPQSKKVVASWSTLPATGPHGLAVDSSANKLYTAGNNGFLVAIDLGSGKIVSRATIVPDVDQIVLDPLKKRVYCACASFISVVDSSHAELKRLADVPTNIHVHTLTLDPETHAVWVSFKEKQQSFLQKFNFNQ